MRPTMPLSHAYLRHPDLFPARIAGEYWGSEQVRLRLAGTFCTLRGLTPSQELSLTGRFGSRADGGNGATGGIAIDLFRIGQDFFGRYQGAEYILELDFQPHRVGCAGLDFVALLVPGEDLRAALWTHTDGDAFVNAVAGFCRLVTAYRLLASGGLLLHGASVLVGEEAHLFVGPSGTGKTTLSRIAMAGGLQILSDDLTAVWPDGSRLLVEGFPLSGRETEERGVTGSYPVRTINRLQQAGGASYRPGSAAERVAWLIGSTMAVNADPFRRSRLLDTIARLSEAVRIGTLGFTPESTAREIVDQLTGARRVR